MGPPSYMRSVVDRNVIMRRMTVKQIIALALVRLQIFVLNPKISKIQFPSSAEINDKMYSVVSLDGVTLRRWGSTFQKHVCTYVQ